MQRAYNKAQLEDWTLGGTEVFKRFDKETMKIQDHLVIRSYIYIDTYISSILSWEFRCSSSGFNLIQSLLQYLLFFPFM